MRAAAAGVVRWAGLVLVSAPSLAQSAAAPAATPAANASPAAAPSVPPAVAPSVPPVGPEPSTPAVAPAPPPPAAPASAAPGPAPPLPASTARPPASGFQIAFRTGLLLPFGDASGAQADSLSRRYAWQLPLVIDIGGRFARSFFVGVYAGLGVGSTGSDARVDAACVDDDDNGQNDIVCSAVSFRLGLEVQYSFQPGESLNPWIGYGFGLEGASASLSDHYAGLDETVSSSGITYANLSAGLDLRHKVGVGPFIDVALGQYDHTTTDLGQRGKFKVSIDDRALHAWLMLGLRIVVNP